VEEPLFLEVREETGRTGSIARPLFAYSNRDQLPTRQTFQIVFLCDYVGADVRLNPVEHDDFAWLSWSPIGSLDLIAFARAMVSCTSDPSTETESAASAVIVPSLARRCVPFGLAASPPDATPFPPFLVGTPRLPRSPPCVNQHTVRLGARDVS